jgi:L-amino acid N-acyltransferase YncA
MSEQGQKHKLKNGTEVLIRPSTTDDFEKSLAFFQELPETERLYLRVDVTNPEVVRERLNPPALEHAHRIVALEGDRIVADATLLWPQFGWMSHIGELRVIVNKEFRKHGLATVLFRQLFIFAVKQGLEKLQVKMMPQQEAARSCVERLGFTEEGVLPGFVLDIHGKRQDLVLMSINI